MEFVEIGDEFLVGARIQDAGNKLFELIFVLLVGVEPGAGLFCFADGLDNEGAHAFGQAGESIFDLRMQGPDADERLVDQGFFAGRRYSFLLIFVFAESVAAIHFTPASEGGGPCGRNFGNDVDASADVFAAFGVVSGRGVERMKPASGASGDEFMKWPGAEKMRSTRWVAADVIEGDERDESVEGGVFEALGHDRASEDLPAEHKFEPFTAPKILWGVDAAS